MLSVTAVDDTAAVLSGEAAIIDVTANDTGSNLSVASVGVAANGTTELTPQIEGYIWDEWIEYGQYSYSTFVDWYNDYYGYGEPLTYDVQYTADVGFSGTDSFEYTITDDLGNSATATVAVTVGANQGPIVVDDSYTLTPGTSVTLDVLANDSDPEGHEITVESFGQPNNGTVQLIPQVEDYIWDDWLQNGEYSGYSTFEDWYNDYYGYGSTAPLIYDAVYTPNAGFAGTDVFAYTAEDALGAQSVGAITVHVQANQEPVTVNDAYTTDVGQPVVLDLLANDSDPEGHTLSIISIGQPANGTITSAPNVDSAVWDDWINNGQYYGFSTFEEWYVDPYYGYGSTTPLSYVWTYEPADGFSGTDTFTYTVQDSEGAASTGQVTITIAGNSAPVANSDTWTTVSGEVIVIDPLSNDIDPDGHALELVSVSTPVNGTLTSVPQVDAAIWDDWLANGQSGYATFEDFYNANYGDASSLVYELIYTADGAFVGTESLTYVVSDEHGAESTGDITIEVLAPNTPPLAVDDATTVAAGGVVVLDVLANDSDPDGDSISIVSIVDPTSGSVVVRPRVSDAIWDQWIEFGEASGDTFEVWYGTYFGSPDDLAYDLFYTAAEDFAGDDTFSYTIEDDRGDQAEAVVTVTVTAPDSPVPDPEVNGDPPDPESPNGESLPLEFYTGDLAVPAVLPGTVDDLTGDLSPFLGIYVIDATVDVIDGAVIGELATDQTVESEPLAYETDADGNELATGLVTTTTDRTYLFTGDPTRVGHSAQQSTYSVVTTWDDGQGEQYTLTQLGFVNVFTVVTADGTVTTTTEVQDTFHLHWTTLASDELTDGTVISLAGTAFTAFGRQYAKTVETIGAAGSERTLVWSSMRDSGGHHTPGDPEATASMGGVLTQTTTMPDSAGQSVVTRIVTEGFWNAEITASHALTTDPEPTYDTLDYSVFTNNQTTVVTTGDVISTPPAESEVTEDGTTTVTTSIGTTPFIDSEEATDPNNPDGELIDVPRIPLGELVGDNEHHLSSELSRSSTEISFSIDLTATAGSPVATFSMIGESDGQRSVTQETTFTSTATLTAPIDPVTLEPEHGETSSTLSTIEREHSFDEWSTNSAMHFDSSGRGRYTGASESMSQWMTISESTATFDDDADHFDRVILETTSETRSRGESSTTSTFDLPVLARRTVSLAGEGPGRIEVFSEGQTEYSSEASSVETTTGKDLSHPGMVVSIFTLDELAVGNTAWNDVQATTVTKEIAVAAEGEPPEPAGTVRTITSTETTSESSGNDDVTTTTTSYVNRPLGFPQPHEIEIAEGTLDPTTFNIDAIEHTQDLYYVGAGVVVTGATLNDPTTVAFEQADGSTAGRPDPARPATETSVLVEGWRDYQVTTETLSLTDRPVDLDLDGTITDDEAQFDLTYEFVQGDDSEFESKGFALSSGNRVEVYQAITIHPEPPAPETGEAGTGGTETFVIDPRVTVTAEFLTEEVKARSRWSDKVAGGSSTRVEIADLPADVDAESIDFTDQAIIDLYSANVVIESDQTSVSTSVDQQSVETIEESVYSERHAKRIEDVEPEDPANAGTEAHPSNWSDGTVGILVTEDTSESDDEDEPVTHIALYERVFRDKSQVEESFTATSKSTERIVVEADGTTTITSKSVDRENSSLTYATDYDEEVADAGLTFEQRTTGLHLHTPLTPELSDWERHTADPYLVSVAFPNGNNSRDRVATTIMRDETGTYKRTSISEGDITSVGIVAPLSDAEVEFDITGHSSYVEKIEDNIDSYSDNRVTETSVYSSSTNNDQDVWGAAELDPSVNDGATRRGRIYKGSKPDGVISRTTTRTFDSRSGFSNSKTTTRADVEFLVGDDEISTTTTDEQSDWHEDLSSGTLMTSANYASPNGYYPTSSISVSTSSNTSTGYNTGESTFHSHLVTRPSPTPAELTGEADNDWIERSYYEQETHTDFYRSSANNTDLRSRSVRSQNTQNNVEREEQHLLAWAESTRIAQFDLFDATGEPTLGEPLETDRRFQQVDTSGSVESDYLITYTTNDNITTADGVDKHWYGASDVVRTADGISNREYHDIQGGWSEQGVETDTTRWLTNEFGTQYQVGMDYDHWSTQSWMRERHELDGGFVEITAASRGGDSDRQEHQPPTWNQYDGTIIYGAKVFDWSEQYESDDVEIKIGVNDTDLLVGSEGKRTLNLLRPDDMAYFTGDHVAINRTEYRVGGWRYPSSSNAGYNDYSDDNAYVVHSESLTVGSEDWYGAIPADPYGIDLQADGSYSQNIYSAAGITVGSWPAQQLAHARSNSENSGYSAERAKDLSVTSYNGPPPNWAYTYPMAEDYTSYPNGENAEGVLNEQALKNAREAWRPQWWEDAAANGTDDVARARWYADNGMTVNYDEVTNEAGNPIAIPDTFEPGAPEHTAILEPEIELQPSGRLASGYRAADLIQSAGERMLANNGHPHPSSGLNTTSVMFDHGPAYAVTLDAVIPYLYPELRETPENTPPEALDDVLQAVAEAEVELDVLANDTDPDGDIVTIKEFDPPANGTVTLGEGTSFGSPQVLKYTPAAGFTGTDSFEYTIEDAYGATSTALVTVTVGPNAAPVTASDLVVVPADETSRLDILANDFDPESQKITIDSVDQPEHGSVEIRPDVASSLWARWIAYGSEESADEDIPHRRFEHFDDWYQAYHNSTNKRLNYGWAVFYTPNLGFVGNDDFTYTISDPHGGTAIGYVAVTVGSTAVVSVSSAAAFSDGSIRLSGLVSTPTAASLAEGETATPEPFEPPASAVWTTLPEHGQLELRRDVDSSTWNAWLAADQPAYGDTFDNWYNSTQSPTTGQSAADFAEVWFYTPAADEAGTPFTGLDTASFETVDPNTGQTTTESITLAVDVEATEPQLPEGEDASTSESTTSDGLADSLQMNEPETQPAPPAAPPQADDRDNAGNSNATITGGPDAADLVSDKETCSCECHMAPELVWWDDESPGEDGFGTEDTQVSIPDLYFLDIGRYEKEIDEELVYVYFLLPSEPTAGETQQAAVPSEPYLQDMLTDIRNEQRWAKHYYNKSFFPYDRHYWKGYEHDQYAHDIAHGFYYAAMEAGYTKEEAAAMLAAFNEGEADYDAVKRGAILEFARRDLHGSIDAYDRTRKRIFREHGPDAARRFQITGEFDISDVDETTSQFYEFEYAIYEIVTGEILTAPIPAGSAGAMKYAPDAVDMVRRVARRSQPVFDPRNWQRQRGLYSTPFFPFEYRGPQREAGAHLQGAVDDVGTALQQVHRRTDQAAETANCVAPTRKVSLGIEDHLDDFSRRHGADSWKVWAKEDPMQWKGKFYDVMNDPKAEVLFNLDGVDVWGGVTRASRNAGGATDWELLQIYSNKDWWSRIRWIKDGKAVPNPFE